MEAMMRTRSWAEWAAKFQKHSLTRRNPINVFLRVAGVLEWEREVGNYFKSELFLSTMMMGGRILSKEVT